MSSFINALKQIEGRLNTFYEQIQKIFKQQSTLHTHHLPFSCCWHNRARFFLFTKEKHHSFSSTKDNQYFIFNIYDHGSINYSINSLFPILLVSMVSVNDRSEPYSIVFKHSQVNKWLIRIILYRYRYW
jgi:hypothetical protein